MSRWMSYIWVCSLCMCISCEKKEENKKLTKVEKFTVDTLFNNIKDSLYKEMDTICIMKFDSIYQVSLDSIKAERMAEINQLLQKK